MKRVKYTLIKAHENRNKIFYIVMKKQAYHSMKPKPKKMSFEEAQDELIDAFLKLSMKERFEAFFEMRAKVIGNDQTDPSMKRIERIR